MSSGNVNYLGADSVSENNALGGARDRESIPGFFDLYSEQKLHRELNLPLCIRGACDDSEVVIP